MRIIVCMKQVPDTASRLEVRGGVQPVRSGVEGVVNPFDEFALEAALQLREEHGGEVILLSLAAGSVEETIFHGLAMGADAAHVVTLHDDAMPDALATSRLLVDALRTLNADLICCGERAVDGEAAQVPAAIGEMLGVQVATGVEKMELDREKKSLTVRSRIDATIEVRTLSLPCVCAFIRGDHVPRYPSLDAIFDAGAKPIEYISAQKEIPEFHFHRTALAAQDDERAAEKISGDAANAVAALLARIAEKTDVLS